MEFHKDQNIVGVDIGGTKINMGIVNNGSVVKKVKLDTPTYESKDFIVNFIIDGIIKLIEGVEIVGIGIGVPGLLDETNGIVYDVINIPSWQEVHLADAIKTRIKHDVWITNDANSFVLGEKHYGKGQHHKNFVGITLGTGLGVGFIINDQLHSGIMSSAGELGVIPYLDHDYEHYCSGQFFKNEFGMSGVEVYEQAINGNPVAQQLYYQYGRHLGNLVKHILHVLAPEAICFGGSIKDAFHLFETSMWETLETFPYQRVIEKLVIEKSDMNDIAILGAAGLYKMRSSEYNKLELDT